MCIWFYSVASVASDDAGAAAGSSSGVSISQQICFCSSSYFMMTVSPAEMSPEMMSLDNGRLISLRMMPRIGRAP